MYELNIEAARLAEQRISRITVPGAYVGQLIQAVGVRGQNQTLGIELVFEMENKARAYFTLWALDVYSRELYGYRYLSALMVCLGLKKLESKEEEIRKWDEKENGMVNRRAQVFKALLDKEIGVLLDTEEYEKRDGGIGIRGVPVGFFCARTRQMASEILDQTSEAEKLKELSKMLKHRPLKKAPLNSVFCATAPSPLSDIDDDISF